MPVVGWRHEGSATNNNDDDDDDDDVGDAVVGCVDVWCINLDQLTPEAWPDTLTADDLRRAGRFVRPSQREHFLQARCCLRTLLGRYTQLAPPAPPWSFNAYGKPLLAPAHGLCFNLSHSGNLAAIAIGRQSAPEKERGKEKEREKEMEAQTRMEIGIDIERLRTPDDLPGLARLVFCSAECAAFEALAKDERTRAFLTCWTRKEAYLKALGVGLMLDPRRINVGLDARRAHIENLLEPGAVVVVDNLAQADHAIDHAIIALAICGNARQYSVRVRHFAAATALEPAS